MSAVATRQIGCYRIQSVVECRFLSVRLYLQVTSPPLVEPWLHESYGRLAGCGSEGLLRHAGWLFFFVAVGLTIPVFTSSGGV